jgi:hypothetical protein
MYVWEVLEEPTFVEGYGTQVAFAISNEDGAIVAFTVTKEMARQITDALN